MGYALEVCVDSVQSAIKAQEGGATRLELCSNLIIGGTTPSKTLFQQVRENTDLEIRVLLRPRFGDFCYDEYEFASMKEEAIMYHELGADAIVTGILRPDGSLNIEQMEEIVKVAKGTPVTLHRAYDVCKEPLKTMEQAIELGLKTILTSGQKNSAWEGRELLLKLYEKSNGRIEILAGAGISPEIIEKMIPFTKIQSYHMSGKIVMDSKMQFRCPDVSMGLPGFDEYKIWQTDATNIRQAVQILKRTCK